MDDGKPAEAIVLLEQAEKLDPANYVIPYELALAQYQNKEYSKAAERLKKLLPHKDVNANVYQLLGNTYDMMGDTTSAIRTYKEGLKKFPNSGSIYLELGNVKAMHEQFAEALDYYEEGIRVDPRFPSNYYRAAIIYCGSSERIWGVLYGELFMNLERNSQRTATMSEILLNTYKDAITFESDTSMRVNFSKIMLMSPEDAMEKNPKMPFTFIFETKMLLALLGEQKIDIASMDRIRRNFLKLYTDDKNTHRYKNIIFAYQQELEKKGHLEAYNYWLLMKGDPEGFRNWRKDNGDKWESFIAWFRENQLKVDDKNRFHSGMN